MLFVRHDLGVYTHPTEPVHRPHHYWGQVAGSKAWEGKPWTASMWPSPRLGHNLDYLTQINPSRTLETTDCSQQLSTLRRSIEAKIRLNGSDPLMQLRVKYKPPEQRIF